MADNKREAKLIKSICVKKQKKTYETSGCAWHVKGNVNKPELKVQYSPPQNRQNRHYANGRTDKLVCKNMSKSEIEEEMQQFNKVIFEISNNEEDIGTW